MMFGGESATPLALWFGEGSASPSARPADGTKDSARSLRRLRVLIVEDEFFIALDVQGLVESLDHDVVGIAVSAEQAVQLAEREKPDLVLMDVRLVGIRDGIDAAVEIKDRFGIDSVFVTANTDPATRARADAAKPLAFLEKPLNVARLRSALALLLPQN